MISVIIPVHNVAQYLGRCLESVMGQTCSELEIVVVDDGSSDQTPSLLEDYAARDARIRILRLPENKGVLAARAAGIKASSGELVGFVDGDDWVAPQMYEKLAGALQTTKADISICGMFKAHADGRMTPKVRFSRDRVLDDRLLERFCNLEFGTGSLCNKLYRRAIVAEFATQEMRAPMTSFEDYLINIGCFAAAARVAVLDEMLYYYVTRGESASQRDATGSGFVRLLRAYETTLRIYAPRGPVFLRHIDELFAHQLEWQCYRIPELSELTPHREELQSILHALADLRPESIYALVHGSRKPRTPRAPLHHTLRRWLRLACL